MTVQELITHCPRVYHMAETGTWESISKHGLRSTEALLDLFEINGELRRTIASERRPESVEITHPTHGKAVIRDQKPMSDGALRRCLNDGISPSQWYGILNRRVFFWASEKRLNSLLAARAYRAKRHCVLTFDTTELLGKYADSVALCPINSGSTIFNPHPRGMGTFRAIHEYPFEAWKRKRGKANAIVELVIDYAVPNAAEFVIRAEERKGDSVVKVIFQRA